LWIERNGRWVQRLKALPWPRGTVRLQITVVFLAFTVLLLGVLNTYPVISTRDAVVRDKEQSLTATAAVISSALSGLDSLNSENVNQVMEILDVTGVTRIFITNERGSVVYDTWGELVGSNVTGAYPVLEQSMAGQMVFTSQYTHKQAFSSTAAAPVMVGGTLIGSVYLAETDAAQADMIGGIQSRLLTMSAVLALIAVALSAALVYDPKTVALSMLGTYLFGLILDHFIFGVNVKKRVCIMSDKRDEITDFILHTLHSGASLYQAVGAYTGEAKEEIMKARTEHET